MVKAVFGENLSRQTERPQATLEIIAAYNASKLNGWEAKFYLLPNPLLIKLPIRAILEVNREGKRGRIYPPFALSQKNMMTGFLKDTCYPEGKENEIKSDHPFPDSAVKGLTFEFNQSAENVLCHAIRIDEENGFPSHLVLKDIIDQITQYTNQWWLRSPQSPFRGPLFMGAFLNKEFEVLPEFKFQNGGEIESSWHGIVQTQIPLGNEKPLDEQLWLHCMDKVQKNIPAEIGLLTFSDALAHYMSGNDNRALIDLTICFEVLANKKLFYDTGKMESNNKKLLKITTLAEGKTEETIRKLIIDRDNAAHGREPYNIKKDPHMLVGYFDAIRKVINAYLAASRSGFFHELASSYLKAEKRR